MKIQLFLLRFFFLILISSVFVSCRSGGPKTSKSGNYDTATNKEPLFVFVGTYTQGQKDSVEKSKGIYVYEMNPNTGELSFVSNSPQTVNPSYLVIHPSKKWLYAVNEVGGENENGYISAFSITDEKQLQFINSVSSQGTFPCYISVDHTGKFAMTANYGNGTVALYPIRPDGSLAKATSVHQHTRKVAGKPEVQPHAHMIVQRPGEEYVYSTDLGTDMVFVYKIDTVLNQFQPAKENIPTQNGSGPRHIEFHPGLPCAYVVNELNGTIEAFSIAPKSGVWKRFQTISTLPANEKRPASCADIHVTPSGKYLYASNRGEINNLAIFEINQQSGELKNIGFQSCGGSAPRSFVIDPRGIFLLVANQNSNNIVTYKIDKASGKLSEAGKSVSLPAPVCLKFL